MSWSEIRWANAARFTSPLIAAALLVALVAAPARADESLESLRTEFHRETDAVKRAKLFPKLGTALIAEMRKLESTRQYDAVAPLFLEYRDGAKAAYEGLAASGRDAEKHSKGFRELEMHLRQSLHSLNDIVFGLPLDDREPLRGPQQEIEQIEEQLIRALFPRGPQPGKTPPSAARTHPLV
jgi:hypothetical protein